MSQPKTIWTPTPKQTEFLSASEEEVLYGGAAGGGKTDGLIIDALGAWQHAIEKPRYQALILRRTFPELADIINRSRSLYPVACSAAKYKESSHEWVFPSGARIVFGYAEREQDKYQYQGREFAYIGFEELTQWATDGVYTYLFSRLRTSDPSIKCLMRATCNPGGVGHKWVQDRWSIAPNGDPTRRTVEVIVQDDDGTEHKLRVRRRFIPAKVGDNPHLGIEYRANLLQLDETQQQQLLHGRWDAIDIPGQIYRNELAAAYEQGRICRVPHDPALPVHTIWDLGVSDSTSIIFMQRAGRELWLVDYYEASGEGLPHYANVLQQRGYVYGDHYAPHDIEVRELGSGKSRIETARSLGINFRVVRNIGREDGINAARMIFPRVYIDEVKCARLIECLRFYRRDYNQKLGEYKPTPVHDFASHGADSFRYMAVGADMFQTAKPKASAPSPVANYW